MHPIVREDLENVLAAPLPWEMFNGKNVLISGANGFLPAYMVQTLLVRNEGLPENEKTTVWALVRNLEKALIRFAPFVGRANLHFRVQDVSEPVWWEAANAPLHVIIHAASQASPKFYGTDPVGTLTANVSGTQNLLNLARKQKTERFLFFSSGEVYGQVAPENVPTKETEYGYLDPATVRACYGESKRMGETLCVAYQHQYGVPASIVRPFHTYGPGMALDDGRVFADFVADLVARRNIVMKSDGRARRAFCYLADAAVGFFTVLMRGLPGEAYNVGNPDAEVSILELARTLAGLCPDRNVRVVEQAAPVEKGAYLQSPIARNSPDIAKIRALGWEPHTGIADGFGRTVRSFEGVGCPPAPQ